MHRETRESGPVKGRPAGAKLTGFNSRVRRRLLEGLVPWVDACRETELGLSMLVLTVGPPRDKIGVTAETISTAFRDRWRLMQRWLSSRCHSGMWWIEHQRNGMPHVHVLLAGGGMGDGELLPAKPRDFGHAARAHWCLVAGKWADLWGTPLEFGQYWEPLRNPNRAVVYAAKEASHSRQVDGLYTGRRWGYVNQEAFHGLLGLVEEWEHPDMHPDLIACAWAGISVRSRDPHLACSILAGRPARNPKYWVMGQDRDFTVGLVHDGYRLMCVAWACGWGREPGIVPLSVESESSFFDLGFKASGDQDYYGPRDFLQRCRLLGSWVDGLRCVEDDRDWVQAYDYDGEVVSVRFSRGHYSALLGGTDVYQDGWFEPGLGWSVQSSAD